MRPDVGVRTLLLAHAQISPASNHPSTEVLLREIEGGYDLRGPKQYSNSLGVAFRSLVAGTAKTSLSGLCIFTSVCFPNPQISLILVLFSSLYIPFISITILSTNERSIDRKLATDTRSRSSARLRPRLTQQSCFPNEQLSAPPRPVQPPTVIHPRRLKAVQRE